MRALFYVFNLNFSWSNLISFASKLHLLFINCKWMSFVILKSVSLGFSFSRRLPLQNGIIIPCPSPKRSGHVCLNPFIYIPFSLKDIIMYLQFRKFCHNIISSDPHNNVVKKTKKKKIQSFLLLSSLTQIEYIRLV